MLTDEGWGYSSLFLKECIFEVWKLGEFFIFKLYVIFSYNMSRIFSARRVCRQSISELKVIDLIVNAKAVH